MPLSRNLGTLISWKPLGYSGSVTGLIYFFFKNILFSLKISFEIQCRMRTLIINILNAKLCFKQIKPSLHLNTYLLTPCCRVLLEKLTGLQLVKKFPAFHGTRWFITALKSVRQLSLSWASPIQSIYPIPTS